MSAQEEEAPLAPGQGCLREFRDGPGPARIWKTGEMVSLTHGKKGPFPGRVEVANETGRALIITYLLPGESECGFESILWLAGAFTCLNCGAVVLIEASVQS